MVSGQHYTVSFSLGPARLRKWVLLTVIAVASECFSHVLSGAGRTEKLRAEKLHMCSVEHVHYM